mgnify:FL=1
MLSVVIPVLNEAASIENNLLNLQAWRSWLEIIVVDGGSKDKTLALARPLADKLVRTSPGRAQQMNVGAQEASGDYLLFLHADTKLPISMPSVVDAWRQRGSLWGFFPVKLSGTHLLLRCVERGMNIRSRLTRVATGDQCLFISRKLFAEVKGFPNLPLMEDVALCKKLRAISPPQVETQQVLTSSRRWESHGIVKTIVLMWRLRLAYFMGRDPHQLAKRYYPGYKRESSSHD